MKTSILTVATALAFGVLTGCDRTPDSTAPKNTAPTSSAPASSAPAGSGASTVPQSNTPSTPANLGAPSEAEKSPAAQPPVQGREDVRQPEQRRDFQQKGDSAGPKPGG
jgi:uncharacterized lipoprotein